MKNRRDTARLFFALLPDEKTLGAIDFHAAQLSPQSGKKVRRDNYHITLAFLGNVNSGTIDALCLDCETIASQSFSMTISDAGWWKKAGIFWLAPDFSPAPLSELVNTLSLIASRRNLVGEKRPYFPHITLMRKVNEAPQLPIIKPFDWQATQFSLVQSTTYPDGVQYHEIASWPLDK